MRKRFYAALAATLLITVSGEYLFGRLGHSQRRQAALAGAEAPLESIPKEFRAWRTTREEPLAQPALDALQCAGCVNRTYIRADDGQMVNVTLMVGPAETMVVHRPEICMTGGGQWFAEAGPARRRFDLPGDATNELFRTDFRSSALEGGLLRMYYAWNRQGRWEAPDSPRLSLGGAARLYKLYASTRIAPGQRDEDDAAADFLHDFLPVLKQRLFQDHVSAGG